jgi:hypothetical protein
MNEYGKENIMENCIFLNSLKHHFFSAISMLENIIEICPNEVWNKKVSGYVFWQQLLHTIYAGLFWLRDANMEFIEPLKGRNVYWELDKDPEDILSKDDIKKCFSELKKIVGKWFLNKDDNWLKMSFNEIHKDLPEFLNKATNFDILMNQIKHFDYHIGHCESIFRDHNINPGKYIEYLGEYTYW